MYSSISRFDNFNFLSAEYATHKTGAYKGSKAKDIVGSFDIISSRVKFLKIISNMEQIIGIEDMDTRPIIAFLKVLAYSVLSCLSTLFLVAYAELNPAVRAPGNKLSISFLVFSYWIFQSFIKVLYCSSLVFFNFISSLSVFFNLFFISSYETLSSSFKPSIYVSFPVSSSVSEYPKTSLYSDEISFLLFMIS